MTTDETGDETPLDFAFRAMEADPEDETARLRFHERLMDAELFVLLEAEPDGDSLRPQIFGLEEGRFALAFDRDDRLAAFLDAPAPYAALAGRRLAQALAGRGVGIGLNLGVAPSQTLLPAGAIDWLAEMTVGARPSPAGRARAIHPPRGAGEALVVALDAKIAAMAGRIETAWLATIETEDGARLALAVAGADAIAEPGIVEAIAEAARFSGGGVEIDIAFIATDAPARGAFERHGIRFDPPAPEAPAAPRPPGSDPRSPPILRRRPGAQ